MIPGFFSFQEQGLNMIGQFVILVAIITADMFGYQVHSVINQKSVGQPFQGEFAGGILARNRVSVSVDFDAELVVHAGRLNDGRFISQGVEGFELFLGKELRWDFLCLPVNPDIGNRIKPAAELNIEIVEIAE